MMSVYDYDYRGAWSLDNSDGVHDLLDGASVSVTVLIAATFSPLTRLAKVIKVFTVFMGILPYSGKFRGGKIS